MQIAQQLLSSAKDRLFEVEAIVIHAMGEFIESPDDDGHDSFAPNFLQQLGLSAHDYITPSGVIIEQVKPDKIANHARGHNGTSIGIEVLVPGVHTYASFIDTIINDDWVTVEAHEALVARVVHYLIHYQNTALVRHSDISPGRKVDPGPRFNWETFQKQVRQEFKKQTAKK